MSGDVLPFYHVTATGLLITLEEAKTQSAYHDGRVRRRHHGESCSRRRT